MTAHLRNFAIPFIALVAFLLWRISPYRLQWWQVALIMAGASIWDWGWHSRIHHPEIWSARIWVRITGLVTAVSVPVVIFVLK